MGMQRMLQNFSGLFTEEQLRKNMEKYNLQKMFGVVKEYFKKEYGYAGDSIIPVSYTHLDVYKRQL